MRSISWFQLMTPLSRRGLAVMAAGAFMLAVFPGYAAAPLLKLHDHVPAMVARSLMLGRLPSTNHLSLTIGLPLRNHEALEQLARNMYDPKNPAYKHYLTQPQFTAGYGPSEEDYQKVVAYAQSNGLKVNTTYPNRLTVDVEGDVTSVEKAFHVQMRRYRHPFESRDFFAPDVEPSLDLDVPIAHINGLDNYNLPHSHATGCCGSGPLAGNLLPTYGGTDFRDAYCRAPNAGQVTTMTGAGQTVGLLQFSDYYQQDITDYETEFGLPNVNVVRVPINGGHEIGTNGTGECSLDIEMVMSMAPNVSAIYVYECTAPVPMLQMMASNTACKQFSSSWTWGGTNDSLLLYTNEENVFLEMQVQGQSFFNASGDDDGAPTGGIAYPSDSPNITTVGGTILDMSFSGSFYSSESVWNSGNFSSSRNAYTGSTGGPSARYAIPYYQQGIATSANQGSTTMRNVPDVCMVAEDIWIHDNNGGTSDEAGTSCAAPLWAGYMALVNQLASTVGNPSAGFINPAIYTIGEGGGPDTYAHCLNDITSGDNKSPNNPNAFSATTGYDLCTGWGSPSFPLLNALAGTESVYWVDLTVTDAEDPFPDGQQTSPFWYLIDNYVVDKPGALGRVPSGAQLVFEHIGSGTATEESSTSVSGTGVSRIAQRVKISTAPGVHVRIAP